MSMMAEPSAPQATFSNLLIIDDFIHDPPRKRFDRYFLLTGKAAYLAPNSFYFGAAGRLQAVLQRHSDRYEVDLVLSRQ